MASLAAKMLRSYISSLNDKKCGWRSMIAWPPHAHHGMR
jgi:hypothetical protein